LFGTEQQVESRYPIVTKDGVSICLKCYNPSKDKI
jgi:hypothetical protein